jgi:hypothetical protein
LTVHAIVKLALQYSTLAAALYKSRLTSTLYDSPACYP